MDHCAPAVQAALATAPPMTPDLAHRLAQLLAGPKPATKETAA